MSIADKISNSIRGSLYDLNSGEVPNYRRETPVWIERYLNGSLILESIPAHYPAFHPDDSAIILEPGGLNLITQNLNLADDSWIKGSNVRVYSDEVESPDRTTYQGDKVVWSNGDGLTQVLRKTIYVQAGLPHYLSFFLQLPAGQQAGAKDVIRLSSGGQIKLSQLNDYPNRYRILTLPFTSPGNNATLPEKNRVVDAGYAVSQVTNNSVTISASNIAAGQLAGGRLLAGDSTQYYSILQNTASNVNGEVTVMVDASNLVSSGVSVGGVVRLYSAPLQQIDLEFYVESVLSLHFGGIFLEQRSFRTSPIYQGSTLAVRGKTELQFRNNPLADLKTFGIFFHLKEWRGDGNLFDFGNISAAIASSKLVINAGGTVLKIDSTLPSGFKLFLQVSDENSNLSVFLDGILVARANSYSLVGDRHASETYTSEGYRAILQRIIFDELLLDGQPDVGSAAKLEVAQIFSSEVLVDEKAIAAPPPTIVLPPLLIPAPVPPVAQSQIIGVNLASSTVTVRDATNFVQGKPVALVRNGQVLLKTRIQVITFVSGDPQAQIQLEVLYGVVPGDFLVYGNTGDMPGKASVRYPYTPIDQQIIKAIAPDLNRLTVDATLSFARQRAFVTSTFYQDIAEVVIRDKDDTKGYLFVDDVSLLQVGHVISQPEDELLIHPDCCEVFLLSAVGGVTIDFVSLNGVGFNNFNPVPVQVQAVLRASAY